MSCASCAARIEKTISALDGVSSATVNFATEELLVTHDERIISREDISRTISELGYGVASPATNGDLTFGDRGQTGADGNDLRSQRNWVIFSVLASLPIMLTMGMHHNRAVMQLNWLLATVVQFSAGLIFYRSAWASLKNRSANMDVLVALGTSAAYFYSLLAYAGLLGPGREVFFETSAMLIAFIRLGKYLEVRARGKAGEALKKLLHLQSDKACLVTDEGEAIVPASLVRIGDLIQVRPGEIIPVDGVVVNGSGAVDESMVTGESIPVLKKAGDGVTGSTINKNGLLHVRATRIGEDTLLSQIVRMVREAQADKAPIQRFADAVSSWFVPAVIILALVTFFVWFFPLHAPFLTAFKFSIAVIVIACPCAMGLATPTAIMVGSGVALGRGILIKRGSALEIISRLQVLLLDKTGTLTTGTPTMTDLEAVSGVDPDRLLECLATAESCSTHPLGQAVLSAAEAAGIQPGQVADFEERGGYGITCDYAGFRLAVGNERLMEEEGVSLKPLAARTRELAGAGKSLIFVAAGGTLVGVAAFADTLKPNSKRAVAELRSMGIKTCMITGDHGDVAAIVADQVGVDLFEAEVLPERKQDLVKEYQQSGLITAMVGDGINDAPALAQAQIGIAIGGGTDVAKETGDIVLMRDDLLDVVRAIKIGRATLTKVKQNLFWALFYNILGIPIAAGLFSRYGITLKPEYAGLAMALSSVSVVVNSIMIRRVEKTL